MTPLRSPPLTTGDRGFAHHVPVVTPGLERPSFAMPEHVRSVTQSRPLRRQGTAGGDALRLVSDRLRRITGQA
jgi:mRNA-degrading endonuclease toxin of MazEF toxin-antitoxin module